MYQCKKNPLCLDRNFKRIFFANMYFLIHIFVCTNVLQCMLICLCPYNLSLEFTVRSVCCGCKLYKSVITVGSFLLMDSADSIPGASAQLWSPSIPAPSSNCLQLSFHYYMYGTATDMELRVHVVINGKHLL